MPVDSHLTWAEIRDFTPGLWTSQDQLMPPNAAQVMTDCYPLAAGGLRAFYKPTAFTISGIVSPSTETAVALCLHEGLINRSGNGLGNDYYLVTSDSVDTKTRWYRMDQTDTGPPVVWTLIKTTVAGLRPSFVYTANYILSNGDQLFVFGLGAANTTDNGVWTLRYSDGAFTHLLNGEQQLVANYQSRLIVAGDRSSGNPAVIQFTDPALLTNIATNAAPVDISEGREDITGFATFSPGDLIVFKAGAPIYLVEGDLTNYTVRQMNGSRQGGSFPVRGPDGVIFSVPTDGFYTTPDGSQIMPLSKALAASNISALSIWHDHWLITSNGLILDYDTRAWFTSSFMSASIMARLSGGLGGLGPGMIFANAGASMSLWTMPIIGGATTGRAETYTWKSAPLRDPNGRQVEVRAIEIIARSKNGATSSVAVTVNGVTRTLACDSSGRGAMTFYFMARRETLDVQIVSASNAAGVEAPMIEALRVGTQSGHFLSGSVTDVG